MENIKTIKVPSTLFLFQDNEVVDEAEKQLALCIYTYLIERKGMDDKIYCRICDILENCGRKPNSNVYRGGYFDALKSAIKSLQDNGYIGAVKSGTSDEDINFKDLKPKDMVCFEISAINMNFACGFSILPYDSYCKLQIIRIQNPSLYWKSLMTFCYICYKLMYNPYTGEAKNSAWTFSQEKIVDNLRVKISIPTMQKVLSVLQEYNIIGCAKVYVKVRNNNSMPYCIGTAICVAKEDEVQVVQKKLKAITANAQNNYITNYINTHRLEECV